MLCCLLFIVLIIVFVTRPQNQNFNASYIPWKIIVKCTALTFSVSRSLIHQPFLFSPINSISNLGRGSSGNQPKSRILKRLKSRFINLFKVYNPFQTTLGIKIISQSSGKGCHRNTSSVNKLLTVDFEIESLSFLKRVKGE